MGSSTLEDLAPGSRVYIDASIFIYHFSGVSTQCRDLLARCETGEIQGVTSVLTLAEVAHRLMTLEAVARQLVPPGGVVKKLREKPEIVRRLSRYQEQVEKIPLMGVEVEDVSLKTFLASLSVREQTGLLTNDSLVLAAARERGAGAIASGDGDFQDLSGIDLYRPTDL
jgi:predicted nucleic acid-binding protein